MIELFDTAALDRQIKNRDTEFTNDDILNWSNAKPDGSVWDKTTKSTRVQAVIKAYNIRYAEYDRQIKSMRCDHAADGGTNRFARVTRVELEMQKALHHAHTPNGGVVSAVARLVKIIRDIDVSPRRKGDAEALLQLYGEEHNQDAVKILGVFSKEIIKKLTGPDHAAT